MVIQTEKPYYGPGEQVNGKVYMEIRDANGGCNVHGLDMSIKGKENVAFNVFRWEGEGEDRHREKDRKKKKHTFLHAKERVASWEGGYLANGNYEVSFYFILPNNCPSSVCFKDGNIEEKPKVETKYEIKAKLDVSMGGKDFKYSHVLMVREPEEDFKMGEDQKDRDPIVVCCCLDKGHSEMKTSFEKTVYFPNEVAHASAKINNKDC